MRHPPLSRPRYAALVAAAVAAASLLATVAAVAAPASGRSGDIDPGPIATICRATTIARGPDAALVSPEPTCPTGDPTGTPTGTVTPTTPTGPPTTPPTGTPTITATTTVTITPPPTTTITPSPTVTTPPGPPCDPPPYPSVLQPSVVQDMLERVAARILDLVAANGYPGFTGVSADIDNARLLLCWLGTESVLPPPIEAIVASPGEPVSVVRQYGKYGKADLDSRVAAAFDEALEPAIEGTIENITVPEEGTGLIVQVLPYVDPPADPNAFLANAGAVLSGAAGVDVTVTFGMAPELTTRYADASPFSAGARITSRAGGGCSSAFGVAVGRTHYQLTALHCFTVGTQVFTGGAPAPVGGPIGTVRLADPQYDSEAIQVAAPGQAGPTTYVGGVNDRTEGSVRSSTAGRNVAGMIVCDSGSYTGELCELVIRRTDETWFERRGLFGRRRGPQHGPMVRAVAPAGRAAVARGNSGGPMIKRDGVDRGQVEAMGVVSAGSVPFRCRIYDATDCFNEVVYAAIGSVLASYGAVMVA